MSTLKRLALTLLLIGGLFVLPGCLALVAAGAAGGGVAYAMGDLQATVEASPPQIIAATEQAFDDLDLRRISAASTDLDGKAIARTAADKKVTITVKRETGELCKLSIRVGTFGDEALSRMIHEKIKANL